MKVAAETFALTPRVGAVGRSLTAAKIERVFSPIKTTLTLLESDGERLCIISSHFMTHYYHFSNILRRRVADRLSLPIERVIDFSSHNHCTPKLVTRQYAFGSTERETPPNKSILTPEGRDLVDHAEATAARLVDRLEAVEVRWGLGHERRISHNRKGHRADGSTYMMREADRLKLGADFNGDIDDDAPILGFYAADGAPRCFLAHFTAHPVTAYDPERPVVFGEYAQVACDALSEAMGGVPVGFLQGCAGDVNAKGLLADLPVEQKIADATRYGHCLVQAWIDGISRATVSERTTLGIQRRIVELPFTDVPPLEELNDQIADMEAFIQRCADNDPDTLTCQGLNFPANMTPRYRSVLVEPLLRWAKWARAFHTENRLSEAPRAAEFEVVVLRIGDAGIVGLSCEPFDAIGRQIKRSSPLPITLPCGYMHDTCLGYVPDSGNNGDREYMSAFYRYTTSMLPYAQPAGDRLAAAAVEMLIELAEARA